MKIVLFLCTNMKFICNVNVIICDLYVICLHIHIYIYVLIYQSIHLSIYLCQIYVSSIYIYIIMIIIVKTTGVCISPFSDLSLPTLSDFFLWWETTHISGNVNSKFQWCNKHWDLWSHHLISGIFQESLLQWLSSGWLLFGKPMNSAVEIMVFTRTKKRGACICSVQPIVASIYLSIYLSIYV